MVDSDAQRLDSGAIELDRFLASVERRAFRMAEFAVHDVEDAMDVVQEAMLALVKRYARRPAEEWPPLFWRILSTRIADVHRRRTRTRRFFVWGRAQDEDAVDLVDTAAAPEADTPEARFDAADVSDRIIEAVRSLPHRQQQAFLLRDWEGLSVAETARAMDCAEGSVKAHLARAHARLRDALGEIDD